MASGLAEHCATEKRTHFLPCIKMPAELALCCIACSDVKFHEIFWREIFHDGLWVQAA